MRERDGMDSNARKLFNLKHSSKHGSTNLSKRNEIEEGFSSNINIHIIIWSQQVKFVYNLP